jgi:hypothetical protein
LYYINKYSPFNYRDLAVKLWDVAQLQLPSALCEELLNDVIHPVDEIQQAGAQALAALLKQETGFIDVVLEQLLAIYHEKLAVRNVAVFHVRFMRYYLTVNTTISKINKRILVYVWIHIRIQLNNEGRIMKTA